MENQILEFKEDYFFPDLITDRILSNNFVFNIFLRNGACHLNVLETINTSN